MKKPKKAGRVKSRRVWSAEWDTGGMAGGGAGWVYEKGGWYFFRGTEEEPGGPCLTLRAALQAHYLNRLSVDGVVLECTSPVLSADEMAALVDLSDAECDSGILLNGEAWEYVEPGAFRRAEVCG